MNQLSDTRAPRFTDKQGQYLAFIHADALVKGPSARRGRHAALLPRHAAIGAPDGAGLGQGGPHRPTARRAPRSIKLLVDPDALPKLRPSDDQLVKSTMQRYELLGALLGGKVAVEPYLITLEENAEPYTGFRHAGTEFIYMLSGEVVYAHAGATFVLKPGDSCESSGNAIR